MKFKITDEAFDVADISDLSESDRDLVITLIARLRTKDANAYEAHKTAEDIRKASMDYRDWLTNNPPRR
jgi:hypothetical protein